MADYLVRDTELEGIADAIRQKGGTSAQLMFPTEFVTAIGNISGGTLQTKSVSHTPTETTYSTTVTPDTGYDGLSSVSVSVAAVASDYVGTGITRRSNTDLTASGATVSVPAGYYLTAASKAVATGSASGPSSVSGSSASVSTGTNTLTLTKSISITPTVSAGYVSSGTATTATVSLTGSVTTKAAATYTPTTTSQTIAAGTYLTGAQTISGDANLVAGNIKSGTTIFGVTGTYSGGGGGATNFVTGTFTTPTTTSTTASVAVPYTGSGYPVMLVVVVEGGMYNSTVSTWYNSLTRYAVGQITIGKSVETLSPSYGTSGTDNYGSVELIYKNSTSTSTSYSSTRSVSANSYSSSNANGTNTTCVRWKSNNKTISYRTGGGSNTSYGLLASTTYRYYAVYSS